ncbi:MULTISPECIES: LasU family protein [Latilactobacillus]
MYSLYLKAIHGIWINMFVFSLAGLGVYTPIILFIDSLTLAFRGEKGNDIRSKLFYSYFIIILVAIILLSLYLMTHN